MGGGGTGKAGGCRDVFGSGAATNEVGFDLWAVLSFFYGGRVLLV